MEKDIVNDKKKIEELGLEELDLYWQKVKKS